MKRTLHILFLFFLVSPFANGQSFQRHVSMDMGWKFLLGDAQHAEEVKFNDKNWRTLNLPHDWSIESEFKEDAPAGGSGGYLAAGIGWYRKQFDVPKSAKGQSIWIDFDGVYMNSEVWINGHSLGKHPNGYTSFYYDLAPFVKTGKNTIAVRVDNSQQPNSRWYSGSGIYRHVWLNTVNPLHVGQWGTYVTTKEADSSKATLAIHTTVQNELDGVKNISLRNILMDEQNNVVMVATTPYTLQPKANMVLDQEMDIENPSLWSASSPHLYNLITVLLDESKVLDQVTTKVGIRTIQFDVNRGFLLNGKHEKLNGVCVHHEAGCLGAAVPEAAWERRLAVLKAMGCNAIRTSHNEVAPEFLDLCDKMGFLVMDEIFDEWQSGKVKYGYHIYFDDWSQKDLLSFIHRDRNHPSIVMWSAGNEIGEQKKENGEQVLKALVETFHREDPTRPVTTGNDNIAADNGSARLPFLEAEDIVGYNYVDRWHERRELFYSIDRHDHPNWKMTGTESVSIPGVRGNYFFGNDSSIVRPVFNSSLIRAEQLWKFVSIHDYVIGDFMWTGIDYLGEARWPNRSSSSGVIDLCGFPKDGYYFYKSQWTDAPMIHLFPHWNWQGREGKIIPVYMYTNCDSVELFLNGKSFGIKALEYPRQGNSGGWNKYDHPPVNVTTGDLHLSWDIPYEAGVLKAVGRKDGKIACTEEIHTTGKPSQIRLSADRNQINANGQDISNIKVEVTDENGLMVPDASNLLAFTVSGNGKLIGTDNGNPREHESMKSSQRHAFNGLALGVLQADSQPGVIHLTVSSPGLKDATLDITTKN